MESENKHSKKSNPREHAGALSAVTFWWMLPIFYTGYKRDLEIPDLFDALEEHKSEKMGNILEGVWKKEKKLANKLDRPPSLLRVILKTFGPYIAGFGCIAAILELGVKMVQPVALGNLVLYYSTDVKDRDITEAYINAAILILSNFVSVFIFHPYVMGVSHISLKIKVSLCSIMYRKSLRLSKRELGQTTVGQIVNLMSNDVRRMNGACLCVHDLWIGPLACIIITVIMYQKIGIAAIFGPLYIISYIPFQSWLGKRISVLRLQTALKTDKRLRLMNEIINGIQVIKIYTWEKPFASLVSLARRNEISKIRRTLYIRGINNAFTLFTTRTAVFCTILAYVLFGNDINASQVFVVTACLNLLKQTMTDFFPSAVQQIAEAYISVKRIEKFLIIDESKIKQLSDLKDISNKNGLKEPYEINKNITNDNGIVMKNVTAKWNTQLTDNTLSNLTLTVVPGRLVTVIGPVGSGKTSLLHAILKEFPLTDGAIEVNGIVSYASQESWLFSSSIRQNILFGQPMDKIRYQNVINCCALQTDLSLLPYGDKTLVGERGVTLSGGQRARINLARAVYKQADIYLLDDPLSAVDAHVGKHLFDFCINGLLKEKTVILVTHQLQYLKEVDQIIILNNGVKEGEGTYDQLKETGLDFAKLLDEQTQEVEDQQDGGKLISLKRNSTKSVTSNEEKTVKPIENKELKSIGNVRFEVYKAYLRAAGGGFAIFIVVIFFILSQVFATAADYFVSYWVNLEEYRTRNNITLGVNGTEPNNFWDFTRDDCIYIYSGIIILTMIITFARSFIFFKTCMKASVTLHDNMFLSITRATMRFFNTNNSGRILNRFSKDMGNVDEQLPSVLVDVLQFSLSLVGIIVVVAIVNPWLLIPTGVVLIIFYFFRVVYLPTSRSIKRLEGVTSSPIFGHLSASLQGLTTIRAFDAQHILQKEFDNHQDLHSTAWYLFRAAARTFSVWLDLICILYLSLVTANFFVFDSDEYGGNVGLVITQVMGMLGMIRWGIRQTSELENQMTSVERINEYNKVNHERPLESKPNKKPASTWPAEGKIEFRNLYLTYIAADPPVLKNLSFKIAEKEKIGIVGRTGAGKSSLIAALFQLTNTEGSIIIDDIDIKYLGLHDLRSKISIITQEPVLFSGTLRKNLDPFDEYSDEVLWKALKDVELIDHVNDLSGGLNSKMLEGGSNFSVGQRQLVCLARAIVRTNKILVLDEATANVDPQTDSRIQQTIRTKFSECTVLTIAHRLHTIMDSDKVLVIDAGSMVEFDHPHILLANPDGFFYKMVQQTGSDMSQTFKTVAEENYKTRNEEL